MARKFDAKVTLLHVMQIPAKFYPGMETSYVIEIDMDAMRDDAEEKLAYFYEVPRHPLPEGIQIVVEAGDPAHSIVEYAAANHVDLIMLPTHGYGRYRSLLLGSVAAKVLHDAQCPVWTSVHTANPLLSNHSKCDNILCAIDMKPGSGTLIKQSLEWANLLGAKVRLVHAVPGAEPSMPILPDADFRQFLLRAAREEAVRLQTEVGTNLEFCTGRGEASKVVGAAACHHHADLVIIGRGMLHATLGRLRTHSYSIIRDSPCPVLSL
jgi:nucleotide-binding universal stress UspA family protein